MATKEQLKLQQEDWMVKKWRPAMGWTYMGICILDMAVFPILWSLLQALQGGQVTSQWNPLTLQGAGLFHIAMGAVLGIAAWSRGQEKMNGVNGQQVAYYQPQSNYPYQNGGMQNAAYRPQSTPEFTTQVTIGYGGRKAPPPSPEPLI